jgi:signal peptidase I
LFLPFLYRGVFFLGFFVLYLGVYVGSAVDAWRCAATSPARARVVTVVIVWAVCIVASLVSGLANRRMVVEAYKMPSGSMVPTLLVGDHLFIDKTRSSHRGDVVAFPFPEHPEQDFVKRIVAVSGERIEFRDGRPIIDGKEVPSCKVGPLAYKDVDSVVQHEGDLYVESLDGHMHFAFYDRASGAYPETQGPWTVAPGEVFVAGDNRNNSHDSRMWWGGQGGGVSATTIRGVAVSVWLSVSDDGFDMSRVGARVDDLRLPARFASLQASVDGCVARLK